VSALEQIRGWLALGWPVFPVREDKTPRIRDWEHAARGKNERGPMLP
jgi:hypothetical protein